MTRRGIRSSQGDKALGRGSDFARVGDIELNSCAGSERLREWDGSFVKLAGMVGVGVESRDGKGNILTGDPDSFPVERRGNLQGNARQRSLACVAARLRGRE